MIHYMSMVKQDEPYLNYNLKHKQGDYIMGLSKLKIYRMRILNQMSFQKVNI